MDVNNSGPHFLIVGTMKSGTSTLADVLATHPRIHIDSDELHYFDDDEAYQRGPKYYASLLRRELRDQDGSSLIGEKTPTYSFEPKCRDRIFACNPDVKLIWIFRDPVKRTISNYLHAYKMGAEERTFAQALHEEAEGKTGDRFKHYGQRSLYAQQVDYFLEKFSNSQMHFLAFEQFVKDPVAAMSSLIEFLELEPFTHKISLPHSNKTRMPFSPASMRLLRRLFGMHSLPYKIGFRINQLKPGRTPEVDRKELSHFIPKFSDDMARLKQITGLDLSCWNSKS